MSLQNENKLSALRRVMKERDISVYIVPSEDEHQSEYTSPADQRREFISGFTGSAGIAIITIDEAALSTDGRYFLQASKQLGDDWRLIKQGVKGEPNWKNFAVDKAIEISRSQLVEKKSVKIGVDPTLITDSNANGLKKLIQNKISAINSVSDNDNENNIIDVQLFPLTENLIDLIWNQFEEKPNRPLDQIFIQGLKYTGLDFDRKIEKVREELTTLNGLCFVVTALDEIAWLFNLRGADIPYNPVFFSYALITPTKVILYINDVKVPNDVKELLLSFEGFEIKDYNQIWNDAKELRSKIVELRSNSIKSSSLESQEVRGKSLFLASTTASWELVNAFGEENVQLISSPVEILKGQKDEVEIQGQKNAHIKDGVALVRYFSWLEQQLNNGATLDEVEAADKSTEFRQQMEDFVGLSFDTISSTGKNAAIIHYSPIKGQCSIIDSNEIYLNDTGAQYRDGTTDTTRTLHFGTPKENEIHAYTLVLKGHIAVATAVFPEGANGYMLDTLARQYLWSEGLDYRHGTGHGVGSFLNVHEGPFGIGSGSTYSKVPLKIGNVCSNEPGYYEDGKFGIRIESIVVVTEAKTPNHFEGKKFLQFETITMVPLCRKLIDIKLLTQKEIDWIDEYHKKVYYTIEKYFGKDEIAFAWLKRETAPLEVNK